MGKGGEREGDLRWKIEPISRDYSKSRHFFSFTFRLHQKLLERKRALFLEVLSLFSFLFLGCSLCFLLLSYQPKFFLFFFTFPPLLPLLVSSQRPGLESRRQPQRNFTLFDDFKLNSSFDYYLCLLASITTIVSQLSLSLDLDLCLFASNKIIVSLLQIISVFLACLCLRALIPMFVSASTAIFVFWT